MTAAPERIPLGLVDQLSSGGRMIVPVGPVFENQELFRVEKGEDGAVRSEALLPVRFVKMIG